MPPAELRPLQSVLFWSLCRSCWFLDLDLDQKRISLSLRDLEPEDEAVEIVENPEPEEIPEDQE